MRENQKKIKTFKVRKHDGIKISLHLLANMLNIQLVIFRGCINIGFLAQN